MSIRKIYYALKPIMPRIVQIALRRNYAAGLRVWHANTWPIDRRAVRPPDGWPGWPDGKKFAVVMTHDVDTLRGYDRCVRLMELDKSLGFRSAFNLVPRRYTVEAALRHVLQENGFEVGVHGLYHDGKYFESWETFQERARHINGYIREWKAVGFRAPSMLHNLDWMHELDIEYDASTFDTDPFEPQPDGIGTIFPFWVPGRNGQRGYVELPYTLPQDFLMFVLLKQRDIGIWKKKLDWVAENGGMALLITHPDYMVFDGGARTVDEYPAEYYRGFLEYVNATYGGQYWSALPRDVARYVTAALGHERVSAPSR